MAQIRRRAPPDFLYLKEHLNVLSQEVLIARYREVDPVRFVHQVPPEWRELTALIASSLAFGNVTAIGRSVQKVLVALGVPSGDANVNTGSDVTIKVGRSGSPSVWLSEADIRRFEKDLGSFVHRVYRDADLIALVRNYSAVVQQHGSLGRFFAGRLDTYVTLTGAAGLEHKEIIPSWISDTPFFLSLCALADALGGAGQRSRGLMHLIPDPRRKSACKRLLLFLRWMVRPADGVDLGLWNVPPSRLLIPVDTHIFRIAKNLGLTDRKSASLRTSVQITQHLASIDPEDPVRFDFALCHFGISRNCPSRPDPNVCGGCSVRAVCRHWRNTKKAGPTKDLR